jgi:hypothetical protein
VVKAGQPCPLCESPLGPRRLEPFSGDEGPLRITLQSMPSLGCATGHVYFVDPKFPLWLMNHLLEEDEPQLPAGEGKGFILKQYVCKACGAGLEPKEHHRHTFHVPLGYGDHASFSADLSMPVFRCTGCGKEQLHSLEEIRKLTPAALVHAFKGAGIKAPG